MRHSTERQPATQPLDALIAEAAAATDILPTIDRCRQLHDQLRPAVAGLADRVRRRLDYLARDTADWQRFDQALLQAQGALLGDLGSGLRSAALHVQTLGEAAAVLDGCIRDGR